MSRKSFSHPLSKNQRLDRWRSIDEARGDLLDNPLLRTAGAAPSKDTSLSAFSADSSYVVPAQAGTQVRGFADNK
jgi:hypothetical protein